MNSTIKFSDYLREELEPQKPSPVAPLVIDLFAGYGRLALGFEMAEDACETYAENLLGACHCVRLTKETDLQVAPDIVIGGPPCQPFNVGGLQMGSDDPRDGFPVFLACIKKYSPKIAMFENVRGILYKGRHYLANIAQFLENLGYIVEAQILQAIHFGMPQKRERLFVTAHVHGDGNDYALRTREIIEFWNEFYELQISPGSYDDVRRKTSFIWSRRD